MTEPIHFLHPSLWERLSELEPAEVCRRAKVAHEGGTYIVRFLNELYRIDPKGRRFELLDDPLSQGAPSVELQVVLITYLLNAKDLPLAGKWVQGKGLRGGVRFFASHPFPLEPLLERYGRDPQAFLQRASLLGGERERFGDAGVRFLALPRVPICLVLWKGDEEFEATISVLFDATADRHLPLDALYGLVLEICRRMGD
ncbi:MAG: hypothetical protein DRG36_03780 [Deltaproteobacteria bacterium]|nr:MAG: hypothetical protein DRG36_03780 [Deltaproteobacteria bacterium]